VNYSALPANQWGDSRSFYFGIFNAERKSLTTKWSNVTYEIGATQP
jgi:hypothetical protein